MQRQEIRQGIACVKHQNMSGSDIGDLECIRVDPSRANCRGILAAQQIKPQAIALADSRGIACVEVDLAVLRGEREPDLTLFAI